MGFREMFVVPLWVDCFKGISGAYIELLHSAGWEGLSWEKMFKSLDRVKYYGKSLSENEQQSGWNSFGGVRAEAMGQNKKLNL